jgi:AraC family transcriptional regulator of adaptative response/methylated-DNA-[protein]-cysteine methyltransferase
MYEALVRKDPEYEGIFFAAVKTTGIFCRPTCTARKPKPENVEFFSTCKEAIVHGYRPCKVCEPMERAGATPEHIQQILTSLSKDPGLKLKDGDLRKRGVDPYAIRRWFKKHHGITFHAYKRMLRINTAFTQIRNGESVSSVAYANGYDSLSGFNDSYKAVMGTSPINSKDSIVIIAKRFETPLGPMFAGATDQGLCLLEFTDRRMLENEFKDLSRRLKAKIIQGEHSIVNTTISQLEEYFNGTRKVFDLPLHTPGTDFQNAVWNELRTIPYGTTRSYKQQSIAIKMPDAIRAVASANGMNRIAIVIPCHRVIGSDGKLTGYGGGLWRKKWLLDHEMQHKQGKFF